jgi:hypothetical protein
MPIIADVSAGPAILILGVLLGGAILLAITLIEAVVLRLLKWASFWRSLRDSLIVNVASALAGLVMYVLGTPRTISDGYDPARGGRIYETLPPTIPPLLAWLLAWALSVAIEGGLLFLLARRPSRQTWTAALVINLVSYLTIGLFILAPLLQR